MSAAALIATHLTAPYGPLVSETDVIDSLKSGCFSASSQAANDILAAIFLETSPRLILRCARETGTSLEAIQRLYRGSILLTGDTCPELEESLNEAVSRASSGF